jgi:hypothetical protein
MSNAVFKHIHRVTYSDCTLGNHIYYSRYLDLLRGTLDLMVLKAQLENVIEETERNLRALRQLSLVILIPAEGTSPERVRVIDRS